MLVLTNVTLMTEKPEKALDSTSLMLQSSIEIDNPEEKTSVGSWGIDPIRRS